MCLHLTYVNIPHRVEVDAACTYCPVCSGCHRLGGLNTLSETGSSKVKVPADSMSFGSPFPGSQTADFLLCPHPVEGETELSGVSFLRTLIPIQEGSAL